MVKKRLFLKQKVSIKLFSKCFYSSIYLIIQIRWLTEQYYKYYLCKSQILDNCFASTCHVAWWFELGWLRKGSTECASVFKIMTIIHLDYHIMNYVR